MTIKLKSLFAGPRSLEHRLTSAFESKSRTVAGAAPTQPFELVELAAEEVASHVHLAGRGRYAFPYNSVTITFAAPAAEDQARFQAICAGLPSMQERVIRRLTGAGCDVTTADVDVHVAFSPESDASWAHPFHVALARVEAHARPSRDPGVRIDVLVTHGTAERGAYTFTTLPIAIGRGGEVRDGRHQLLRINHVAFTDGEDDINKSVSRRHARIEIDRSLDSDVDARGSAGRAPRPRIVDDNSAQGTSVIRKGRGIPVPKGSRGLVLQSGDEIVLGQARMTVTVGSDTGV